MSSFVKTLINRMKLDSPENREKIKKGLPVEFPSELANPFIDYMLERSYLDDISERDSFLPEANSGSIGWIRIDRLPVHPDNRDYDLLPRWQSVLSSIHTWNDRFLFLLQRKSGATHLYIGLQSREAEQALPRLETSLVNCMPGLLSERLDSNEALALAQDLMSARSAGAVTGIPSFRNGLNYGELQTLDSLAFGIRDSSNRDTDFSLLVVADPISDSGITDIISRFQELGTNIHKDVHKTYTNQEGTSKTRQGTVGLQTLMAVLGNVVPGIGGIIAYAVGGGLSASFSKAISYNLSESTDFLNKFAEYSEKATDAHCERLRKGRNQGFWNVGVYVLSNLEKNVNTVLGMLRSIYSGDESYLEPIRIHKFKPSSGALGIIRSFSLIPIALKDVKEEDWHIFGTSYQYVSTPVNTQELSIFTSLPRKDVPGLRFVKTAVRFANNPGADLGEELLTLGKIKDFGVEQKSEYKLDINSLVRHSLIVGSTGSGKSTTCRKMIQTILDGGRKLLIIEPAKEEYARWAVKMRKEGKKVNLFMPGIRSFEGERVEQLKLNPFQPAAVEGADIDMMTRCEEFIALVNASLPASDVLPVIMDETFYTYLRSQAFGEDFMQGEMSQLPEYPKIEGAIETARRVLKTRGYTDEVSQGIGAAVETRLTYLARGKRGEILNVRRSTPWSHLFDETTVVNLSRLANPKDRSLVMSLLLLALHEYRVSKFTNDQRYREDASANKLMHLTVVEEAHNVLSAPPVDHAGTGNPQQVVADLFSNMLSEIRAYGEGLLIVDQSPTKLIGDVIKNTNYKIVHRLSSKDDCIVMESALALREDQTGILPTLEVGDAIVYGDCDDAASWIRVQS